MKIPNGTYVAKARGPFALGEVNNEKRTPYIEFEFVVSKGPQAGSAVRYNGYLSEGAAPRTLKSLRNCGWRGNNVGEFADGGVHGCSDEVEIVVESETGKNGNTYSRISWVNQTGSAPERKLPTMNRDAALNLGDRLKALAEATPATGASPSDTDYSNEIPF